MQLFSKTRGIHPLGAISSVGFRCSQQKYPDYRYQGQDFLLLLAPVVAYSVIRDDIFYCSISFVYGHINADKKGKKKSNFSDNS